MPKEPPVCPVWVVPSVQRGRLEPPATWATLVRQGKRVTQAWEVHWDLRANVATMANRADPESEGIVASLGSREITARTEQSVKGERRVPLGWTDHPVRPDLRASQD